MMRRIFFVALLFVLGVQNAQSQNTKPTVSENSSSKIVAKTELRKKYFGVNFSVENGFNTISNHLNFNFISSNGIHLNREMMLQNNISKLIGINFGLDVTTRYGLYINCISIGGNFSGTNTPAYVHFTSGIGYSFFFGGKNRFVIRPHLNLFFQSFDYNFGDYDSTAAFFVNGQNQNLGFYSVKIAYINSIIGMNSALDFVLRVGEKHPFDLFFSAGMNQIFSSYEKIAVGFTDIKLQNQTILSDDDGKFYDKNIMTLTKYSLKIGFGWEFD